MPPTDRRHFAGKIAVPLDLLLLYLVHDSIVVGQLIYKWYNQVHYGTSFKALMVYLYCQLL